VTGRPRLLDLFCGAGGAAMGYHLAGYEVTGVDLSPQPRYPFTFIQADALEFPLDGFDLIHASPPCQSYSRAARLRGNDHPRLIEPVRDRLAASGIPWVIENVPGAPLIEPVMLCGGMFGLKVYRHRLFEASFPLPQPEHPGHLVRQQKMGRPVRPGEIIQVVGHTGETAYARQAMGIWWMTSSELAEAIPPPYAAFVAQAAAAVLRHDLQPQTVTLEDPREARRRALAADRARRYRARRNGRKVPLRKPGPSPAQGEAARLKARLDWAAAELALLRAGKRDAG
jgi:DNA (cytosine-5)-methyltransferase 1